MDAWQAERRRVGDLIEAEERRIGNGYGVGEVANSSSPDAPQSKVRSGGRSREKNAGLDDAAHLSPTASQVLIVAVLQLPMPTSPSESLDGVVVRQGAQADIA